MKTESLKEWLARGNQIKKVEIESNWKTADLLPALKNADKYQSKGGRNAKAMQFVYRSKDEKTIDKFLNAGAV